MHHPNLPPELHQLIIDFVGEEVIVTFTPINRADDAVRKTLRSCSFVCKDWHAHSLRYIFHDLWINLFGSDEDCGRYEGLFQLIKVNPLIGKSIRRLLLSIKRTQECVTAEFVENLCREMTSVEVLDLTLLSPRPLYELPDFPSPLNGIYHLLASPHLHNLSISAPNLPLRLLEIPPNIRSLTLQGVVGSTPAEDLFEEQGYKGAPGSTTLEKLTVSNAHQVLDSIAPVAQGSLSSFFAGIKYLNMMFHDTSPDPNSRWNTVLEPWRCLQALIIHWCINGKSLSISSLDGVKYGINAVVTDHDSFFAMCQSIPWSSFQALRSLTCSIFCDDLAQEARINTADTRASSLFLAGPSYLPQLSLLHITYHSEIFLSEPEDLDIYLDAIFFHQLNRTIERRGSFPALQEFDVGLKFVSNPSKLQESDLMKRLVEKLPAVFGVGGRRETCGWDTSIKASVDWPM